MISGDEFIKAVEKYFSFLSIEHDFKISEKISNGNVFYDVQYSNTKQVVSISLENIENYLLILVQLLKNGMLPDFDDKSRTFRLNELNEIILSKVDKRELELNNIFFSEFQPISKEEKQLLKAAKELRVALKFLNSL